MEVRFKKTWECAYPHSRVYKPGEVATLSSGDVQTVLDGGFAEVVKAGDKTETATVKTAKSKSTKKK